MRDIPPPTRPARVDHWRRYRQLLGLIAVVAVVAIGGALFVLRAEGAVLRPNFVIALSLGIGASLLLAGALMGLVFVSANSGHDDAVERLDGRRVGDRDDPRG